MTLTATLFKNTYIAAQVISLDIVIDILSFYWFFGEKKKIICKNSQINNSLSRVKVGLIRLWDVYWFLLSFPLQV